MIGTGDSKRPPKKPKYTINGGECPSNGAASVEKLRLRAQQLSLREQIERHHFLLERLSAASARLVQSLELGDVCEAIAEIIANLIGSEQIAIFYYHPAHETFSVAWSCGVEPDVLRNFTAGGGLIGRAVQQAATQFRDRIGDFPLRFHEEKLTACVVLKSSREVVGVIAIFGLLPQKDGFDWADFELFKFLETYGAVALQYQKLFGDVSNR